MPKATADQVRKFADDKYVKPNRRATPTQITIRAGDVHDDMDLKSQMPQVCGAIGSNKFQKDCRVTLVDRQGPTNGANVYFTFDIIP